MSATKLVTSAPSFLLALLSPGGGATGVRPFMTLPASVQNILLNSIHSYFSHVSAAKSSAPKSAAEKVHLRRARAHELLLNRFVVEGLIYHKSKKPYGLFNASQVSSAANFTFAKPGYNTLVPGYTPQSLEMAKMLHKTISAGTIKPTDSWRLQNSFATMGDYFIDNNLIETIFNGQHEHIIAWALFRDAVCTTFHQDPTKNMDPLGIEVLRRVGNGGANYALATPSANARKRDAEVLQPFRGVYYPNLVGVISEDSREELYERGTHLLNTLPERINHEHRKTFGKDPSDGTKSQIARVSEEVSIRFAFLTGFASRFTVQLPKPAMNAIAAISQLARDDTVGLSIRSPVGAFSRASSRGSTPVESPVRTTNSPTLAEYSNTDSNSVASDESADESNTNTNSVASVESANNRVDAWGGGMDISPLNKLFEYNKQIGNIETILDFYFGDVNFRYEDLFNKNKEKYIETSKNSSSALNLLKNISQKDLEISFPLLEAAEKYESPKVTPNLEDASTTLLIMHYYNYIVNQRNTLILEILDQYSSETNKVKNSLPTFYAKNIFLREPKYNTGILAGGVKKTRKHRSKKHKRYSRKK